MDGTLISFSSGRCKDNAVEMHTCVAGASCPATVLHQTMNRCSAAVLYCNTASAGSCRIQKFTLHFNRVLQVAKHLQNGFVSVCTRLSGSQVEQSPPCCLLYLHRVKSPVPSVHTWGTLFHKSNEILLDILEEVFSKHYHTT